MRTDTRFQVSRPATPGDFVGGASSHGGHWTVETNQSDIEAAIELLAEAVRYLCQLEELALERELRSAPDERREAVGPLLNDRDVMHSFANELLDLRDRAAASRRGEGNR